MLADVENLTHLRDALLELQAECIAVPELTAEYLQRGHAVHFRCWHPDASRMRVDVMSVLRGVEPFESLWGRRTTVEHPSGVKIELVSLPDLVAAKKTQRDKDWPMIRRLIEADFMGRRDAPSASDIKFWLLESRTPAILRDLQTQFPGEFSRHVSNRRVLAALAAGDERAVEDELAAEERRERDLDRAYWLPLRTELEALRRNRPRN